MPTTLETAHVEQDDLALDGIAEVVVTYGPDRLVTPDYVNYDPDAEDVYVPPVAVKGPQREIGSIVVSGVQEKIVNPDRSRPYTTHHQPKYQK